MHATIVILRKTLQLPGGYWLALEFSTKGDEKIISSMPHKSRW